MRLTTPLCSSIVWLLAALPTLWGAPAAAQSEAKYLAETREARWSVAEEPELRSKAAELGTATAIYEYVRNHYAFALYDGARGDSINTFAHRRGNDVDLATLLIAMLRSQGIPARYATGAASFSSEDLTRWLQIPHSVAAVQMMTFTRSGVVTTLGTDGESVVSVAFPYVWVQAAVPLDRYRAAGPATGVDCAAQTARCAWVDLDPSFKRHGFRPAAELVDVSAAVQFNYDALYRAEQTGFTQPDGIERREKNPVEIYEEMILKHLRDTPALAGKTLDDVVYVGKIEREAHGILPTSLPFATDAAKVKTFASVVDHDADKTLTPWTKTVRFTVRIPGIAQDLVGGVPIPLVELSTQELKLVYESTDFDDPKVAKQLVARLGGRVHAILFTLTGKNYTANGAGGALSGTFSGAAPGIHTSISVDLRMQVGSGKEARAHYAQLNLGSIHVIGAGGEHSSWSQVRRSARRLRKALDLHPVLAKASEGGALYVDRDRDGVIDTGEPRLLEDPVAQRALTGNLLAMVKNLYVAQGRDLVERVNQLHRTAGVVLSLLGVVTTPLDVRAVEEGPFSVLPLGLLVDMRGSKLAGPFKIDKYSTKVDGETFKLQLHALSALEHEVLQELTGVEALSTVKGIQRALGDGGTLVRLGDVPTPTPIATALTAWGFGSTLPAAFRAVELDFLGHKLWLPRTAGRGTAVKRLEIMPGTVTTTSSAVRRRPWKLFLDLRGLGEIEWDFTAFRNVSRAYQDVISHRERRTGGVFATSAPNPLARHGISLPQCRLITGQVSSPTGPHSDAQLKAAQANLPVCFRAFLAHPVGKPLREYMATFDRNAGFNPADYRYRAFDPTRHLNIDILTTIRDEVVFGLDVDGDGRLDTGAKVEYYVPSRVVDAELLDLAVWIRHTRGARQLRGLYAIQRAGGGYQADDEPIVRLIARGEAEEFGYALPSYTVKTIHGLNNNDRGRTIASKDPIATATGNVFHDETDLQIRGRGRLSYQLTRTYNSASTETVPAGGGPLGPRWSHSYAMRLVAKDFGREPTSKDAANSDGVVSSVVYTDERGGERIFGVAGSGAFAGWTVTGARGYFDTLDLRQAGKRRYTLRFRNGTEYLFGDADLSVVDAAARLLEIRDSDGNTLSFAYSGANLTRITDNLGIAGRTGLTLSYNNKNKLTEITDWTGRRWRYGYDSANRLSSATDPLGAVTRYGYAGDKPLLTSVTRPADRDGDGSGDVRVTFSYYANERGYSNRNALGHGEQLDYDLFRRRTRVTMPRDLVMEHDYDHHGALVQMRHPDGGRSFYRNTEADSLRWERIDPLGRPTQFSYCAARTLDGCASDTGGNVTLELDPLGGRLERDFDTTLFDVETRLRQPDGTIWQRSYYKANNADQGAVRGKLHQLRLAQLGTAKNVLLQEFRYHSGGNIKERVDYISHGPPVRKRTTTFTYGAGGLHPTRIVETGSDGSRRERRYRYDSLGRVSSETLLRRRTPTDTDPLALTTHYAYDLRDRVVRETDALGNRREIDYDKNGQVTEVRLQGRRPDGQLTTRVVSRRRYDSADRLVEERDAAGGVTTYLHDEAGNVVKMTDPSGHVRRYEYDEINRQVAMIDANGQRSETIYDLGGRIVAQRNPAGETVRYEYDRLDRRTAVIDTLGHTTRFTFDAVGRQLTARNAVAETDATQRNREGVSESRRFDQLGRLTSTLNAANGETKFVYDLLGNRTQVTDAKGQVTKMVFDDLGRMIRSIDPLGRETHYSYDEANNVLTRTARNGAEIHTRFDRLNRPVRTTYRPTGEVETFSYDPFGNLATIGNGELTYRYTYDIRDQLLSREDDRLGKRVSYGYDPAGRPTHRIGYQGQRTDYQFDATGRLVGERHPGFLHISYHYDAAGRLVDRILSSGAKTRYRYDLAGRLRGLRTTAAGGAVVADRTFRHNAVGNVVAIEEPGRTESYRYDVLHRLLEATYPKAAARRRYSYDAVGNRLESRIGEQAAHHHKYDAANRLLEIRSGSATGALLSRFEYDKSGNLTAKRDGAGKLQLRLRYDERNLVVSAQFPVPAAAPGAASPPTGGGSAAPSTTTPAPTPLRTNTYAYDPLGYRIRKYDSTGTHHYLLEGEHLEAVYDQFGALRSQYLRGAVIDEVVVARHWSQDAVRRQTDLTFHGDLLQSVLGVSDHNGAILENTRYAPFGAARTPPSTGTSPNPLRYTGRERDPDTGLYYYRARYYDPALGRFLSEDPLRFDSGDPNFYAYVGNNPLNGSDPTGNRVRAAAIVGGGIGLLFQAGSDLVRGELSSSSEYAGAFAGGVVGGLLASTRRCGPACVGAAAGAASSITTQAIDGGSADSVEAQVAILGNTAFDSAFGAVTGGVTGAILPPAAKRYLSSRIKGKIGEGLTALDLWIRGQKITGTHVRHNPNSRSTLDFEIAGGPRRGGRFVEAKFGTSGPSPQQNEAARRYPGLVDFEYWRYPLVSRIAASGPAAALNPGSTLFPSQSNQNTGAYRK